MVEDVGPAISTEKAGVGLWRIKSRDLIGNHLRGAWR